MAQRWFALSVVAILVPCLAGCISIYTGSGGRNSHPSGATYIAANNHSGATSSQTSPNQMQIGGPEIDFHFTVRSSSAGTTRLDTKSPGASSHAPSSQSPSRTVKSKGGQQQSYIAKGYVPRHVKLQQHYMRKAAPSVEPHAPEGPAVFEQEQLAYQPPQPSVTEAPFLAEPQPVQAAAYPVDARAENQLPPVAKTRFEPLPPVTPKPSSSGQRSVAQDSYVSSSRRGQTPWPQPIESEVTEVDSADLASFRWLQEQSQPESLATPEIVPTQLAEFEALAIGNHPALREAMSLVQAERGRWVQAGLFPNPEIGFSNQQFGSGGEAEQYGLFIGQLWVRGGKLSLDQAVAARKIRVAEQRAERVRYLVLSRVRQSYYELGIAQRRLTLAQRLEGIAAEYVRLSELLLQNLEASQVDVLRAKTQYELVSTVRQNAEFRLTAALVQMQTALGTEVAGLQNEATLQAIDQSLPAPGQMGLDIDPDAWLAVHPSLTMAAFEVDAARWQIDREVAENVPDINFEAVAQYDEATDSGNGLLLVTGPLRVWDRNQGAIQAARSELGAAQENYAKVELSLQRRLAAAIAEFDVAREQVLRFTQQDGILDMSRSTVELLKKGIELGESDRLSLFIAQRELLESELRSLEAFGKALAQKARIESALVDATAVTID